MSNKTVLLTGATGFLGKYIQSRLTMLGFKVITLGRTSCEINCDLATETPKLPSNIDFVVHAAGKAHSVPKTQKEGEAFYEVNYKGTINLLDALKASNSPLKSVIFISSVAVYGQFEGSLIDEEFPLNARDPYGKSKILAEQCIESFGLEQKVNTCILRLPLIAGHIAPGNLGSMIKAIKKGWYLSIGNANVKKSIVLAEDVAEIIPTLFEKTGTYNLTDGYHPTFSELEISIASGLGKRKPIKIPQTLANLMAKTGDWVGKKSPINTLKLKKIQSELTFSDSKSRAEIGWNPKKVIANIDRILQ